MKGMKEDVHRRIRRHGICRRIRNMWIYSILIFPLLHFYERISQIFPFSSSPYKLHYIQVLWLWWFLQAGSCGGIYLSYTRAAILILNIITSTLPFRPCNCPVSINLPQRKRKKNMLCLRRLTINHRRTYLFPFLVDDLCNFLFGLFTFPQIY